MDKPFVLSKKADLTVPQLKLLGILGSTGLGGVAGAYLNEENPLKGALIGAGAGAMGSTGALIRPGGKDLSDLEKRILMVTGGATGSTLGGFTAKNLYDTIEAAKRKTRRQDLAEKLGFEKQAFGVMTVSPNAVPPPPTPPSENFGSLTDSLGQKRSDTYITDPATGQRKINKDSTYAKNMRAVRTLQNKGLDAGGNAAASAAKKSYWSNFSLMSPSTWFGTSADKDAGAEAAKKAVSATHGGGLGALGSTAEAEAAVKQLQSSGAYDPFMKDYAETKGSSAAGDKWGYTGDMGGIYKPYGIAGHVEKKTVTDAYQGVAENKDFQRPHEYAKQQVANKIGEWAPWIAGGMGLLGLASMWGGGQQQQAPMGNNVYVMNGPSGNMGAQPAMRNAYASGPAFNPNQWNFTGQ